MVITSAIAIIVSLVFKGAGWPLQLEVESMTTTFELRASDYRMSVYREKMLEHIFVSEVLQASWMQREEGLEVLRAEIDASGYDIVLSRGSVIRHIQLKSTRKGSRTAKQSINIKLAEKPAGCVVLLYFEEDLEEERIKLEYAFFGGGPNEPLNLDGYPTGKHTKGNALGVKAERPMIREVPMRAFQPISGGISGLLELLFDGA